MKSETEIQQELIQGLAAIVGRDAGAIAPENTMIDLGVDSLGLIEIFIFIEKTFGIKLLESGITRDDLRSIQTLASYVRSRLT